MTVRSTIRLAALVSIGMAAGLGAALAGNPPADVGAGRVAWFDLTTTDLARSKTFYGGLFDWQFAPVAGSDQAAEILAKGGSIGTIRVAEGKVSPFNGVVYIQVSDIGAACARVKELGGTVVPGFPFDLPDGGGAVALLTDPTGHPIGLYSRTPLAPPVKK